MRTVSFVPLFVLALLLSVGPAHTAETQLKDLNYDRYPYRFSSQLPLKRDQKILLRFSREVDSRQVAEHFHFRTKPDQKGARLTSPVTSSRPDLEQIRDFGKYLIPRNLVADQIPNFTNRFVIVEPKTPLPVGHTWQLLSTKGLKDFSGTYALNKSLYNELGTIHPFRIESVTPVTPYDQAMTIRVTHNKYHLSKAVTIEELEKVISISPQPENFAIASEPYHFELSGDFAYDQTYQVTVEPGIAAVDGTITSSKTQQTVILQPNRGFIRLPFYSETQNATGNRQFDVETANLESVRTRVKSLTGANLIYAMKGYQDGYQGDGDKRTIPFSIIPGKTIYDETRQPTQPLDTTESFQLSWDDLADKQTFGAYYVETIGRSKPQYTQIGSHTLVQLTDIGLVWKQTDTHTLVYTFSIASGKPTADVDIRLVNDEAESLGTFRSDESGIALIPHSSYPKESTPWLDASLGEDRHVLAFIPEDDRIGLWTFDIPYRFSAISEDSRRTQIFTDRDAYRPGETVYLKILSRQLDSSGLKQPKSAEANLTVRDNKDRNLLTKRISLSSNGSYDDSFELPSITTGYYTIELDFNRENAEDTDWSLINHHRIQVADYRVNTFALDLKTKDGQLGDDVSIPLHANYYIGKPLSKAKASWEVYSHILYPNHRSFADFDFGDYRASYIQFSSPTDEALLNENGSTLIQLESDGSATPAPHQVNIRAEVTDINQQTISQKASLTLHSSDFYIGLRRPEGIHRVGDTVPFAIALMDTQGRAYESPTQSQIKIEKEIWNTIKIKGSDGKITHRNQKHLEEISRSDIEIHTQVDPVTQLPISHNHNITFATAGDYVISLTSTDPQGRDAVTSQRFRVIGAEEAAWAWDDVVAIDLIPDRTSYQVGDTARLLVRSPVFGPALITTERSGVVSHQTIDIDQHETIIEVPIPEGSAPNLFASVLLVRGSADSPHIHQTADYRIGYCQLTVDDPQQTLELTLETDDKPYYQPGEMVEITAAVTDSLGAGVANAEVTLYAVDEGILSLTDYQTPDPNSVFHAPFPLTVKTGQSLSKLVPENPKERDFGNKGFVIGGGGGGDSYGNSGLTKKIRDDFQAVAFWQSGLKTDAEGKIRHQFNAPDNLTTFRLIGVVAKGNRFASTDNKIITNKPLIIEPSIPLNSYVSDRLDLTAILHNNTPQPQSVAVSLTLDSHAVHLDQISQVLPTKLSNPVSPKERTRSQTYSLPPDSTHAIRFPAGITRDGTAQWSWQVTSQTDTKLTDSTLSTIAIGYPVPELNQTHTLALGDSTSQSHLLSTIDPALLTGRGTIEISVSNSRLLEANDALEYLLDYPYGCLEQTSSTTLPWLSTRALRQAIPDLAISEEEINRAITEGTNRLLAMQTRDGGLSYWTGQRESVFWGSAYAGLVLATAKQQGIDLPASRLGRLWNYLSDQLRNTGKQNQAYDLSKRCLALYTLALVDRAEPSYYDLLFQRRSELPAEGRSLLALAMMQTDQKDPRVKTLLEDTASDAESNVRWYQGAYLKATELLAWTQYQAESERTDALIEELIQLKKAKRGWGSTYSNAWPMLALAAHSQKTATNLTGNTIELSLPSGKQTIQFTDQLASQKYSIPFDGTIASDAIQITSDGKCYTHVRVSSQPDILPQKPANAGFGIDRNYAKIGLDGSLSPAKDLQVGDLVQVTIEVDIPHNNEQYLAIDDPVPAILETVNSSFNTQQTRTAKPNRDRHDPIKQLYTNHREMRKDRSLFFADYLSNSGHYRITYRARVVSPGNCIVPPAKIESMYEPERYGLSQTQQLTAKPLDLGNNQVAKR